MTRSPGFGPGWDVTLIPLAANYLLPRLYGVAVKQGAPASPLLMHRLSPAANKKLLDCHPVRNPVLDAPGQTRGRAPLARQDQGEGGPDLSGGNRNLRCKDLTGRHGFVN